MKTEKVIHLPSLPYGERVSDALIKEFVAFVGDVRTAKFVFLSKTESIVIDEILSSVHQLPPDVNAIYIKIEGQDSFVELKNRTNFKNFNEVSDAQLNSLTIQGPNPVSVRGLEAKVQQFLRPERFIVRTLFYRCPLLCFWGSLIILWFAEYRVLRAILPTMTVQGPLSALSAIFLFAGAVGSMIVYANLVIPAFSYWFPYFEIEGNLSRHRLGAQKAVAALWLSVLATGVWNLLSLIGRIGK